MDSFENLRGNNLVVFLEQFGHLRAAFYTTYCGGGTCAFYMYFDYGGGTCCGGGELLRPRQKCLDEFFGKIP